MCGFYKTEYVGADAGQLLHVEVVDGFSDKFHTAEILFYGDYLLNAA
jgi:hypothetical protein